MEGRYNTKSAGVKRLMREAIELRNPTELYAAQPLQDNLFEWHFTVRGPSDSDFEGGIYHGRIIFPDGYPMKPPNMMILTPNGRFELNKKICLSISGYHPETWLPSWSIRTALLALVGFMPTQGAGAIGSLDYPPAERQKLAKRSLAWKCKECGACMKDALLPITDSSSASTEQEEAKKLAAQISFKDESVLKQELATANTANSAGAEQGGVSSVAEVSTEETEGQGDQSKTTAEGNTVAQEVISENLGGSSAPEETTTVSEGSSDITSETSRSPVVQPEPRRRTSGPNISLFVYIPVIILFLSMFILLAARRMVS